MLAAFIGTAATLWLIGYRHGYYPVPGYIQHDSFYSSLLKTWLLAQLGLPLFTGLTAFAESRSWRTWQHLTLLTGGLALLLLYGWSLPTNMQDDLTLTDGIHFAVLMIVAHLFVAVAPYLNHLKVNDFWDYNRQIFANIMAGAVYTFILWGGLALALLAVGELFDINLGGENYLRLFVVLAGIFNTVFFLHHYPVARALAEPEEGYHVVFKNLCKYILIPIMGLYFLILYAYSFKILLQWELPNGWVTGLVLGFSVAGIFTYLLNFLLPLYDDSATPRLYRRWFWWALLPMVILLFVAVGRRINDYGLTESRYFGALLGIWLLVCCGYFIFSKLDNIKFIPISLAVLGLVSVFGPLNAFRMSARSQADILQYLLVKNGRFANGKAQPGAMTLNGPEVERINSTLHYLVDRKALDRIQTWFPAPIDTAFQNPNNYLAVSHLQRWLNLGSASNPSDSDEQRLWVRTLPGINQANVQGFSVFYRLQSRQTEEEVITPGRYFRISGSGTAFEWHERSGQNDVLLDSFDLRPTLRAWYGKRPQYEINLSPTEATIDLTGKSATLRLLVEEGEIMVRNGTPHAEFLNGLIFVREHLKISKQAK